MLEDSDEHEIENGQIEERKPTERNDENQDKHCWVCYASDEDDENAPWVKPCKCRGTTKWVHQSCLQRWVDEKQRGNYTVKVNCPQCGFGYLIAFPSMGHLTWMLECFDTFVVRACPFVAAGAVVGAIYWTAVTYGAITVMQVVGYEAGLTLLEGSDPVLLLVALPTIPVLLVLGKMVRWEDRMLAFVRASVQKIPLLGYILPSFRPLTTRAMSSSDSIPGSPPPPTATAVIGDPVNATRVMCGALALPSVASALGRLFFNAFADNFTQTVLGGATFLALKGVLKVYYKQQQYVMQAHRKIKDYEDANQGANS